MVTDECGMATYDEVLRGGRLISSGYLPRHVPGVYAELWEFEGYVYIVTVDEGIRCTPFGLRF